MDDIDAHLRWLEARIIAGELRMTWLLKHIRLGQLLGQGTAQLEQLLHDAEQLLQRWHRHRCTRLAHLDRAAADGAIAPRDRPDLS